MTEARDLIYVKGHGFLSFAKNKGGEYGQKFLDRTKKLTTNTLKKTLKKVIQETLEETGDLCGNKIEEKITKAASKSTCEDSRKLTTTEIDKTSLQTARIPKKT